MQQEPLIPPDSTPEMQEFERRIVQALERIPHVAISHDFAARVAAKVPARTALVAHGLRASRFGLNAAVASLLALLAAMLLIAATMRGMPADGSRSALFLSTLEWTLCLQFCALAAWLGVFRRGSE